MDYVKRQTILSRISKLKKRQVRRHDSYRQILIDKLSFQLDNNLAETPKIKEIRFTDKKVVQVSESWLASRAQELAESATIAEKKLLKALTEMLDRRGIVLFFQFPIQKYILDFYIPDMKLAVELDGFYHFSQGQWDNDMERTTWLWKNKGIRVLRFSNEEVVSHPKSVLKKIVKFMAPDISDGEREPQLVKTLNPSRKENPIR